MYNEAYSEEATHAPEQTRRERGKESETADFSSRLQQDTIGKYKAKHTTPETSTTRGLQPQMTTV